MYLVDTNVLSEGAPGRALYSPVLNEWMARNSKHLYISTITVAEIEAGVARTGRMEQAVRMLRLRSWLESVLHLYAWRILSVDLGVARTLGGLLDQVRASGRSPEFADLTIAATAQVHGYTVLTRNMRRFEELGVPAHDPFAALPPENPNPS